jgi:hypothetical protein
VPNRWGIAQHRAFGQYTNPAPRQIKTPPFLKIYYYYLQVLDDLYYIVSKLLLGAMGAFAALRGVAALWADGIK